MKVEISNANRKQRLVIAYENNVWLISMSKIPEMFYFLLKTFEIDWNLNEKLILLFQTVWKVSSHLNPFLEILTSDFWSWLKNKENLKNASNKVPTRSYHLTWVVSKDRNEEQ